MLNKQTRLELEHAILEGIPTRVLQRIADLGGLQQVICNEMEEQDRWDSERYMQDVFSDIFFAMAGDKLEVLREDTYETQAE